MPVADRFKMLNGDDVADNAGIEQAMTRQKTLWDELIANANDKGTIPTADSKVDEFIADVVEPIRARYRDAQATLEAELHV